MFGSCWMLVQRDSETSLAIEVTRSFLAGRPAFGSGMGHLEPQHSVA